MKRKGVQPVLTSSLVLTGTRLEEKKGRTRRSSEHHNLQCEERIYGLFSNADKQ